MDFIKESIPIETIFVANPQKAIRKNIYSKEGNLKSNLFTEYSKTLDLLIHLRFRIEYREKFDTKKDFIENTIDEYKHIKFENDEFCIPLPKQDFYQQYIKESKILLQLMLKNMDYILIARLIHIDKYYTEEKIMGYCYDMSRSLLDTDDECKIEAVTLLISLFILDNLNEKRIDKILQYTWLKKNKIEFLGGIYLPSKRCDSTPQRRMEFMYPQGTQTVHLEYCLNYDQLKCLILFIFSSDITDRLKSKLYLLSTSGNLRRDMLHPMSTLKKCIEDCFISPEELIYLVFSSNNNKEHRCPYCDVYVHIVDNKISHRRCVVVNWLLVTYGEDSFKYQEFKSYTDCQQKV